MTSPAGQRQLAWWRIRAWTRGSCSIASRRMAFQPEYDKAGGLAGGVRTGRHVQQIARTGEQLRTVVEADLRLRVKAGHRHARAGFSIDERTGVISPAIARRGQDQHRLA